MNTKKKRANWGCIIGVIVALALLGGGGLWLRSLSATTTATADEGEIVTAVIGDLAANASASGTLTAQNTARLAFSTSGQVEEVLVKVGDVVTEGQPLIRLQTTELERAVTSAEQTLIIQQANLENLQAPPSAAAIAAAEANVASAQASFDDLMAGPSEDEITSAETSVRTANADIAAASARVQDLRSAPDAAAVQAAEIALGLAQQDATQAAEQHSTILVTEPNDFLTADKLAEIEFSARTRAVQANAALASAQETYDALVKGDPNSLAAAQASVAVAVAQRDAAQARLDQLLLPPSEAQIAQAQATIAQAQASLDKLQRGPTALQIASAEVQVEQSRINWERAKNNLAKATLTAPFGGTITAVNVQVGENANGIVLEMVDQDHLEVVLEVDEIDLGSLSVGQAAVLTLETWPDTEISGQISAIAPTATNNGSDLVTYKVFVALGETDLPVLVGMTANARIETARRDNVLLVPNGAIIVDRVTSSYTVNKVVTDANGQQSLTAVPVTIGLRDGRYTQIMDGLSEGEQVLIGNKLPVATFGDGGGGPGGRDGGGPRN